MRRWRVERVWIVEAESAIDALKKAKPGKHVECYVVLTWEAERAARLGKKLLPHIEGGIKNGCS